MKRLFKRPVLAGSIIGVMLSLLLIGGTVAAVAASYQLNQTVNCTVTINPCPPVQVTLYTDATCTTPVTVNTILNFGTATTCSGTPQTAVWFKTTEINPTTVVVTSDLAPAVGTFSYIVGTPSPSLHSCVIALYITPAGSTGTFTFHVTATGTGP
jgi:hypothetical protein